MMRSKGNQYFIIFLLVKYFSLVHSSNVRLELNEKQNKLFDFMTGGLSQIIWTEDPLPNKLSSKCNLALTSIEKSLQNGDEWPYKCKFSLIIYFKYNFNKQTNKNNNNFFIHFSLRFN